MPIYEAFEAMVCCDVPGCRAHEDASSGDRAEVIRFLRRRGWVIAVRTPRGDSTCRCPSHAHRRGRP